MNKTDMLIAMHPDVARKVWKYGRWHHYVDYSPFKNNKLKLKKGVKLESFPKVNNYGLKLVFMKKASG